MATTSFLGWLNEKLDRLANSWIDIWTKKQNLKLQLKAQQIVNQQFQQTPPPPPVEPAPPAPSPGANLLSNPVILVGGGVLLYLILKKK